MPIPSISPIPPLSPRETLASDPVPVDPWSAWVLHGRHGDDAIEYTAIQHKIQVYAGRLLDGLALRAGMRLLDLGTGDGLVPALALARHGTDLALELVDVSPALLAHARRRLDPQDQRTQDRYHLGSAERLDGTADASVDAVSSRACLAYVEDKPAVLSEAFRVLKPGGRLALVEPLFRDDALMACALRNHLDQLRRQGETPPQRLVLQHKLMAAQFPDTFEALMRDPKCRFSERDLYAWAEASGYVEIQVRLELNSSICHGRSWDSFLDAPAHPQCPSPRDILRTQFTPEEAQALEQMMRPAIETAQETVQERIVYLRARKPFSD